MFSEQVVTDHRCEKWIHDMCYLGRSKREHVIARRLLSRYQQCCVRYM